MHLLQGFWQIVCAFSIRIAVSGFACLLATCCTLQQQGIADLQQQPQFATPPPVHTATQVFKLCLVTYACSILYDKLIVIRDGECGLCLYMLVLMWLVSN